MYNVISVSGNSGPDVRSDCQVEIELRKSGGIDVQIQSKVKALYGESIHSACIELLDFFNISHARIKLIDSGALSFVIYARLEAALASLVPLDKHYLPPILKECTIPSPKERSRITRLYLPGNTPKLMLNAGIHKPDGIILDLEDSVSPAKKHEARYLVKNALRQVNFFQSERMVRINQLPLGLDDLPFIIPNNVHVILLPKCESAKQIYLLESELAKIKEKGNISSSIWIMPIIESALGIENCFDIAASSENIIAMAIGLEDYTSDIGAERTFEGVESFYARSRFINACKAAKIQAIDSVFSHTSDMQALNLTCKKSKAMGFDGMGCIHPRQIREILRSFSPTQDEIHNAADIVKAFESAKENGVGVVAVGNKMIDLPIVNRALRTIALATKLNLLPNNSLDE
jgi:citrate lyase subunit beta / citryl-CoA lyase